MKKVSFLPLGFSKFQDTHDLDFTSLTFSSQDNKPGTFSLPQLHSHTRGNHQDAALMR